MGLFSRSGQDKAPVLAEVAGFVFRYGDGDGSGRPKVVVTGNGGSSTVWLAPLEVRETKTYCWPEVEHITQIVQEREAAWVADWDKRAAA
jgi:hypothetical protein